MIAGGLIVLTGWNWLDPTVSIAISAVIVWGTWGLLREAVNHSLDAVPSEIDPKEVSNISAAFPALMQYTTARMGDEYY